CSSGTSGALRAQRICSRVQRGLEEWVVTVFSPVRLKEDTVDLLEVDEASLVADGFDERTQAEVTGAAQESFAGAHDQGQGIGSEGIVAQASAIQLAENEGFKGFRTQAGQHDRIGDAGADFFVDGQSQALEQRRLADEHEVVGMRKILAE